MDINILDLSNNMLTGHIPQEFNDLHLNFLNLPSNQYSQPPIQPTYWRDPRSVNPACTSGHVSGIKARVMITLH
uniref:Leucine-rich repeat-containing N-terminal plant-type domain-containing protein n=1 Tax=Oryza punctata TaxID=4537 RepID=A0A0E0JXM2_ORYPU